MGIQHWGAFGGFQKKTGPLVGHWTNGQNVITAIPHPSQKPATTAQVNQRTKFKTVVSFLRRLTGLVRVGFQNAHEEKQSAFNAAFTYNYRNAITGVAPNFTINYAKFMFSKGTLSKPFQVGYTIDAVATIKFEWLAYLNTGIGDPTDRITIVVYSPVLDELVTVTNVVPRSALAYTFQLPLHFSTEEVQVWLSMNSANGKMSSDCAFLANVLLL
jgi:hypothetical protein